MAFPDVRQGPAPRDRADLRALVDKAGARARDFLVWWLGELKGLVPGRILRALTPRRTMLLVETGGGDAVLSLLRNGQRQMLGHIDLASAEMAGEATAVREMLAGQARDRATVVLRLPRSDALSWRFQVPPSATAELGQALRYQIELATPFRAEEVLFDYRVKPASTAARTVEVEAVVVPRARAERMVATLGALGLKADMIDIDGSDDSEVPLFNLLPHDKVAGRSGLTSRLNLGLALVVAGLLVAALALPIEQRRSLSQTLEARLAVARESADDALRLKAEVQQLAAEGRFLADLKSRRPHRVEILEALSALLPDHTFLTELKVRGGEVQILGQSAAASSLIALIDGSPLFRDPKFRSSVSLDRRSGRERFNLSFEVKDTRTPTGETEMTQ